MRHIRRPARFPGPAALLQDFLCPARVKGLRWLRAGPFPVKISNHLGSEAPGTKAHKRTLGIGCPNLCENTTSTASSFRKYFPQ